MTKTDGGTTMKPRFQKYLIDQIQSAVAKYSSDAADTYFEIKLSISVEGGVVKVEEQK